MTDAAPRTPTNDELKRAKRIEDIEARLRKYGVDASIVDALAQILDANALEVFPKSHVHVVGVSALIEADYLKVIGAKQATFARMAADVSAGLMNSGVFSQTDGMDLQTGKRKLSLQAVVIAPPRPKPETATQ